MLDERLLLVKDLVVDPKFVNVVGNVVFVAKAYSYPVGVPPDVGADQVQAIDVDVAVPAMLLTTPGGFKAEGVASKIEDQADLPPSVTPLTQKYLFVGLVEAV